MPPHPQSGVHADDDDDDDDGASLPGAIHPVVTSGGDAAAAATTTTTPAGPGSGGGGGGVGGGEPLTPEERMRRYQGALRDALVDRARVRTTVGCGGLLIWWGTGWGSIDKINKTNGQLPNSM